MRVILNKRKKERKKEGKKERTPIEKIEILDKQFVFQMNKTRSIIVQLRQL